VILTGIEEQKREIGLFQHKIACCTFPKVRFEPERPPGAVPE
jgi:hypothetical protein